MKSGSMLRNKPTPEEWIEANERLEERFGNPAVPNYRDPIVLSNLTTYEPEGSDRWMSPTRMQLRIDELRRQFMECEVA